MFMEAADRARAGLERRGLDPGDFVDAVRLFAAAVEDADAARRVWVDAGRPIVSFGGATGQAEVPSPLLRAVQDAEKLVEHYGSAVGLAPEVGRRPVGRPAGAGSAPDRVAPPRVTKLRAVR